jgi:hypothetical protein
MLIISSSPACFSSCRCRLAFPTREKKSENHKTPSTISGSIKPFAGSWPAPSTMFDNQGNLLILTLTDHFRTRFLRLSSGVWEDTPLKNPRKFSSARKAFASQERLLLLKEYLRSSLIGRHRYASDPHRHRKSSLRSCKYIQARIV